jgi:type IV secretion/conjugal transfer VirB4 family ATPase
MKLEPVPPPPLMYTAIYGTTPFRLNLYVGDVGHTLIFGPTGAGKSVLLASFAASFRRYKNATICAFDKGFSMWALVEACGGQHYDIGGDDAEITLAPMDDIDTQSGCIWAEGYISMLYEMTSGKKPNPKQLKEIHRTMTLLARDKKSGQRSISDFLSILQPNDRTDDLKTTLETYAYNGRYGTILDGRADTVKDNSFQVFELDELMAMDKAIAIPVLLYLFRRFERSLKGQPAMLILDEAWVMLGHPVFREKIRQWLKELRKKNCCVVMATQSLSDAVESGLFPVLVDSCATYILLPNEGAEKRGTREHPGPYDLYQQMGLNDTEIRTIRNAVRKRDYFYVSNEGRRLFSLGLGPVALSFLAVSDKETLRKLKALKAEHGSQWPYIWMKQRGVAYEQLVG